MTPLFTIIIPVYNVEAYLRKCLDSVLNQTFGDWECICVDDGSPDNCGAILDEYKATFKGSQRFEVIHQVNAGVSAARNVALDIAQGQWVQFLDSDDSLKLDFLEQLSKNIADYPDVDTIEHSAIYCYDDGNQVIGDGGRLPPEGILFAEDVLADPFGRQYTNLARCSCYKIFRRALIEEHHLRFTVGIPIAEDELFALRFYACAHKIACCPKTAGYLRIFREGSALLTISEQKLLPKLKAAEVLYETWQQHSSKGMTTRMASYIVCLSFLGQNQGLDVRSKCIDALIHSGFYSKIGIPFLLKHGTWKARLFAMVYMLSSQRLKRHVLIRM